MPPSAPSVTSGETYLLQQQRSKSDFSIFTNNGFATIFSGYQMTAPSPSMSSMFNDYEMTASKKENDQRNVYIMQPPSFSSTLFISTTVAACTNDLCPALESAMSIEDFFLESANIFDDQSYPMSKSSSYNSFQYLLDSPGTAVYPDFMPMPADFLRRSSVESTASGGTINVDEDEKEEALIEYDRTNIPKLTKNVQVTNKNIASAAVIEELIKNLPRAADSSNSKSWTFFIPDCDKVYRTAAGLRYHMSKHHVCKVPIRITPKPKKPKRTEWMCKTCLKKTYITAAGYRYHMKTIHPDIF